MRLQFDNHGKRKPFSSMKKFISNKQRQISLHKIVKLLYYQDSISKAKRQMTTIPHS